MGIQPAEYGAGEECKWFDARAWLTDTAVRDVGSGRVAVLRVVLLLADTAVCGRVTAKHLRCAAATAVDRRHDGQRTSRLADQRQQQPVADRGQYSTCHRRLI